MKLDSMQKNSFTENIDDSIQDKNDSLRETEEKVETGKEPFQGGYFLIILSNGLSNVAFKFPSISYKDEPTDIIESIKVRIC